LRPAGDPLLLVQLLVLLLRLRLLRLRLLLLLLRRGAPRCASARGREALLGKSSRGDRLKISSRSYLTISSKGKPATRCCFVSPDRPVLLWITSRSAARA
jgi:hypothetical protein